ncbi:hypothetical protein BV898_04335 [Hypsibius exemplaris]|uniref:Uncharacterized protein n=1 Tax=Hypsibius exemplaris TaxID=2072580 RepID=A0A1W0X2T2_HYPEX|nr:hypothetical protein BV898_04335 [Hypsibius exemplaris]
MSTVHNNREGIVGGLVGQHYAFLDIASVELAEKYFLKLAGQAKVEYFAVIKYNQAGFQRKKKIPVEYNKVCFEGLDATTSIDTIQALFPSAKSCQGESLESSLLESDGCATVIFPDKNVAKFALQQAQASGTLNGMPVFAPFARLPKRETTKQRKTREFKEQLKVQQKY